MMVRPTSVEPVKQIFRTAGWVTKRCPTTLPLPGRICRTPSGKSRLQRQLSDAQRAEGSELGRLQDDGVAGGQGGREAPSGDGHREVPRDDDAHHAQRLVKRQIDATGDGNLAPAVPLGRGGVVLEHVAHVARLPAGVPDDVAGVRHLEQRPAPRRGRPPRRQSGAAGGPGRPVPRAATSRRRSPRRRSPHPPRARRAMGTRVISSPVAGIADEGGTALCHSPRSDHCRWRPDPGVRREGPGTTGT